MKSTTLSGVSLALLGSVSASALLPRQGSFSFECDGQHFPDLDDCRELYNRFSDGSETFTKPSGLTANVLWFNNGDSSNCQVEITWTDTSYVVTGNQVFNAVDGVSITCFPGGTGGYAKDRGNRYTIGVRNNPNFVAPTTSKRGERKLIPMGKRADGDTSFTYGVHTVNAKPGNMRHNIGAGIPGGSTWTWSEEQSVTDSVSFSSSVSAGIEGVLSASLSTEISSSTTTTSGQTTSITVQCAANQYGQIYFQGYAEVWQGVLQPSGEGLTVTKPMTQSDGATAGFYSYECIAK